MSFKAKVKSRLLYINQNINIHTCLSLLIPFILVIFGLWISCIRGYMNSFILFSITFVMWFFIIHHKARIILKKLVPHLLKRLYYMIADKLQPLSQKKLDLVLRKIIFSILTIIWTIFIYYILGIDNQCSSIMYYNKYISETYSFDINLSKEIKLNGLNKYSLESQNRLVRTNATLRNFAEILNRFPDGFFDECKQSQVCKNGMMLDLVTDFPDSYVATTNFYMAADAPLTISIDVDKYTTEVSSKEAISHELFHFIERIIAYKCNVPFYETQFEWSSYNPKDFEYYNSYISISGDKGIKNDSEYTFSYENDINNVYFINEYSKSFAKEDRACIFQYLLTSERGHLPECFESEHIQAKAKKICTMIREKFEAVNGDDIYWEHYN